MLFSLTGNRSLSWTTPRSENLKPEATIYKLETLETSMENSEKFYISIHVISFARPKSLAFLLSQLKDSNFSVDHIHPLDLYIRVPKGDKNILDTANQFQWNLGDKRVSTHNTSLSTRALWIDIRPKRPEEVMIILEDDMRLSPFFLDWTVHLLQQYGSRADHPRDPDLMGFSLAPLLWDEVSIHTSGPWDPAEHLARAAAAFGGIGAGAAGDDTSPLYLHMLPAVWAGVFFADRWAEFQRYGIRRAQNPFNASSGLPADDPALTLPFSRTNAWPLSAWARHLVEFCQGRSYYTLYTHIQGAQGMAAPVLLAGRHEDSSMLPADSDTAARPLPANLAAGRRHRVGRPLAGREEYAALRRRPAPAPAALPLFNLWGRPATRRGLAAAATDRMVRLLSLPRLRCRGFHVPHRFGNLGS
jgi:hypothetical protein